jgi:hypothetical protein
VRSRLAIATLKMADGSVLGGAEAKTLLAGLRDEGHDAGTVGLVVAGLDDDRPVIDFQAAFAAIRGMTVACIHNVQVFQGVETPFWPGFGCGRGDLSWPNWTLGLAQTKSRLNLRNRPGGGQVIAELAPQTPLVYLRYPQETSKGWLKVHTPADQIGWVKASYLAPWQEKSAEQ